MFPGSNGSGTEDITCTEFGEFSNVKETLGFGKGSDISSRPRRGKQPGISPGALVAPKGQTVPATIEIAFVLSSAGRQLLAGALNIQGTNVAGPRHHSVVDAALPATSKTRHQARVP